MYHSEAEALFLPPHCDQTFHFAEITSKHNVHVFDSENTFDDA